MSRNYTHLPTDVRPLAICAADVRIAHIKSEPWVQHATAERVLGYLDEAHSQPRRERMENILLVGESGMGKTMLLRKFEKHLTPPLNDQTRVQKRPIVVMLMPDQPTETHFFHQLLRAMSAPTVGIPRASDMRTTAMRLLGDLETKILVIDELNSMLAGTARQQRLFLQLLRFLSNELRLAFVAAGIPETRHALFSDSQLRGRFTDVELPPLELGEELLEFFRRLAWSLPLRKASPVDSPQLRRLLIERTGGVTLGICKAFERAAIAAIRNGTESISFESFKDPQIWRGIAALTRRTIASSRAKHSRPTA